MKHPTHWQLNSERLVNTALADYREKSCPSAGYNILRYASIGVLVVKSCVEAEEFMNWYPSHMGYVILRLAKAGRLEYKERHDVEI
jgi:hypothetical protein